MRFLVKADYISGRVRESGGHLWSIPTYWLNNLTAVRNNFLDRSVNIVNHNIKQQSNLCHGFSVEHPCTANFANGIVKSSRAIAALPYVPSEYFFVKGCRLFHVSRGHFNVTDLPVTVRWVFVWHNSE